VLSVPGGAWSRAVDDGSAAAAAAARGGEGAQTFGASSTGFGASSTTGAGFEATQHEGGDGDEGEEGEEGEEEEVLCEAQLCITVPREMLQGARGGSDDEDEDGEPAGTVKCKCRPAVDVVLAKVPWGLARLFNGSLTAL
jgi:hypothetical protein